MRICILILLMFAGALPASSASLTQWAIHTPDEVQKALVDKGYNPGPVDGHWGKRSINALKAFQRASGLKPTGVFDDASTDALFPVVTVAPPSEKVESQDAKPVVVVDPAKAEVKPQPTVQQPVLADEKKKDAAASEPVSTPVSKIQVIVEKVPTPVVDRDLKTVDVVKPAQAAAQDVAAQSPQNWIMYAGLSAFALVCLAIGLRRRRKPSARSEPRFDHLDTEVPVDAAEPVRGRPVATPATTESARPRTVEARTAVVNVISSTGNVTDTHVQPTGVAELPGGKAPSSTADEVSSWTSDDALLSLGQEASRRPNAEALPTDNVDAEPSKAQTIPPQAPFEEVDAVHAKSAGDIATAELPPVLDKLTPEAGNWRSAADVRHKILAAIRGRANALARINGIADAATPPRDFRHTLEQHSRDVAEFVRSKADRPGDDAEGSVHASEKETPPAALPSNSGNIVRPIFGTARRSDGSGPISLVPGGPNTASLPRAKTDLWVDPGTRTAVGGMSFDGGLVYVGSYLPRQGSAHENENCLIDPKLKVSSRGDPGGQTMGYWPSYSRITPESRRSYLEWLAGDRADPDAYIGYVFLYFYGLERRLMLEDDPPGSEAVAREVERLLDVYGGNNSFNRYARELLSSYGLKAGPQAEGHIPEAGEGGYDVPMPIKLALGTRVRDGKPFEPELLMRFALSHPETKVRTPARRAPDLLTELFAGELARRHPQGFTVKAGRFKKLKATYRACSGSFTIDVAASDGTIPDISDRVEPLQTARTIFEACSDRLDEYSRALGRSQNMLPTLGVVAKLPDVLRTKVAATLPGNPLGTIVDLAASARPVPLCELLEVAGMDAGNGVGKAKLKELSELLASFGVGNTADPAYALRLTTAQDPVVLFRLRQPGIQNASASPAYRSAQLSMMIGMLVGHADGHFDDTERGTLMQQVNLNPGITENEKQRLLADMAVGERNPQGLEEWSKRLKDLPESARAAVGTELVAVAAADGNLHKAEIKKLELLFKRMGLDPESLYTLIHETGTRAKNLDDVPLIIPASDGPGPIPIPPQPKRPAAAIDLTRLTALRNETMATSILLEGILGDDDGPVDVAGPEPELPEDDGGFDGLERRYSVLVSELRNRSEWSRDDFESLVRNAGLMPGAALNAINEWSLDRFDDPLIEGDDPLVINSYLLPSDPPPTPSIAERIAT